MVLDCTVAIDSHTGAKPAPAILVNM